MTEINCPVSQADSLSADSHLNCPIFEEISTLGLYVLCRAVSLQIMQALNHYAIVVVHINDVLRMAFGQCTDACMHANVTVLVEAACQVHVNQMNAEGSLHAEEASAAFAGA